MAPDRPQAVPVEQIPSLDSLQLERLKQAYINTAEALVGQLEADPEGIRTLLHISDSELESLAVAAWKVLARGTREEFTKQANRRYSYGALNPRRD